MTRIIGIISGKGGVGKTSIITNLGAAIQSFGKEVLLIDGNVTTPNISLQLGLAGARKTLHHVMRGEAHVSEAIYIHPPTNMKVIPAGLSIKDLKSTFKKNIEKIVMELIGYTDIILIDASAGLGIESKYAIEACDEVIIVTNPELTAVTDALKAVEVSKMIGKKVLGVIINKHTGAKHELKPSNISSFLGLPVLSIIPMDVHLQKSLNLYTPVVTSYPRSKAAKELRAVAARIIGQKHAELPPNSAWDKVKKFFKR